MHDSFITKREDSDLIQEAMYDAFANRVDLHGLIDVHVDAEWFDDGEVHSSGTIVLEGTK